MKNETDIFPLEVMDNFFSIKNIAINYRYDSNKPWQITRVNGTLEYKSIITMHKHRLSIAIKAEYPWKTLDTKLLPREYETLSEASTHRR